jgi:hypothetical protein
LLITSWFLVGAFDEGAFLELRAGADQRDQVGCVERVSPGLCGLDELFDDLVARGWVVEDTGKLALTEDGEAGRLRASDRNLQTTSACSRNRDRRLRDDDQRPALHRREPSATVTCPEGVCSTPGGAHPRSISSDREDSACRAHACGVICLTDVTTIAHAVS